MPQQRGMQIDAQLQPREHSAPGRDDDGVPTSRQDDADMGEEPDACWLQKTVATVPIGSKVHLIERMLFRSPKVMFGSVANGAFEDALDVRAAVTADRFLGWWVQETRDTVRYVSHSAETLVQFATYVRMIMSPEGVDRMIMLRPTADGEALTTVYGKDHIEKSVPGLEAVYLTLRPLRVGDGPEAALWVIEIGQSRMWCLSIPKVKFLKLMP